MMTEPEWLACQKPAPMMTFLRRHGSERKFYLAACAAVRMVWDPVREEVCRQCVEVAERYADGEVPREELVRARRRAEARTAAILQAPGKRRTQDDRDFSAMQAAVNAANPYSASMAALLAMDDASRARKRGDLGPRQCNLLRDIFRPFRTPVFEAFHAGSMVAQLAHAAYSERDPSYGWLDSGRLAILADALEESGCTSVELLEHLRGSAPHVRGCWAIDALRGRASHRTSSGGRS
jgi:hypothetical protein